MHILKDFKIIFPGGYGEADELMDNIDINIILKNGDVYFATAFTLQNIGSLMSRDDGSVFWATDMFIVKNITKTTLRDAVAELIAQGNYISDAFTWIGTMDKQYPGKTFDDLPDMADGFNISN